MISIKLPLRHGCSPVNLLDIFGTAFPKNTSGRLLLNEMIQKHHEETNIENLLACSILKYSDDIRKLFLTHELEGTRTKSWRKSKT